MSRYARMLLVPALLMVSLAIGCGGGPKQAQEGEGVMDDMSAYDADGATPGSSDTKTETESPAP